MPFAQSSELPPPSARSPSRPERARRAGAARDRGRVWIDVEVVKGVDRGARAADERPHPIDVPRGDEPVVGHEQNPPETDFPDHLAEAVEHAGAEDDARAREEVEAAHGHDGRGDGKGNDTRKENPYCAAACAVVVVEAPSASAKSWLRLVMNSAPLAGTGVV